MPEQPTTAYHTPRRRAASAVGGMMKVQCVMQPERKQTEGSRGMDFG